MLPEGTFDGVLDQLNHAFKHRYPGKGVRMVGLLFARPTSPLAKAEIIPALDDFHHRSADHIDFFCGGYALGAEEGREYQRVIGSRGNFWMFSPHSFDRFRRDIEFRTRWRYSGACDLLLTNARFNPHSAQASMDFSTTVVCQLDEMKDDGAIVSIEKFFEKIFRFAESSTGDDPTWGFSDRQGLVVAGSALMRVVLSLLPKKIGEDAKRAAHFAVADVSAR